MNNHISLDFSVIYDITSEEHNWNMTGGVNVYDTPESSTPKMEIIQAIGPSITEVTSFYRPDPRTVNPSHTAASHGFNHRFHSNKFQLQWLNIPMFTPNDEKVQHGKIQMSVSTKAKCQTISFDVVRTSVLSCL